MNSEEYISLVEIAAKRLSQDCHCDWRIALENGNRTFPYSEWINPNLEKCKCTRCDCEYNPVPNSRHESEADYEKWPEPYLAEVLSDPWHNHHRNSFVYMWDLIRYDGENMEMTEDEIYNGLIAIKEKYPRILAFVNYNTLYVAIIARMPCVIQLVTEWLERRNDWFTPGSPLADLSYTHTEPHAEHYYETRLDLPPIAKQGENNIPRYLYSLDGRAATSNTDHAIEDWVNWDEKSRFKTYWDDKTIEILARALAVNTRQWQTIECASMNQYPTMAKFVGCVSHCILPDGKQKNVLPISDYWFGTPCASEYTKLVWHTIRSRCPLCPSERHEGHDDYCRSCLPDNIVESVPVKPFERVVSKAVTIRRRRLRGVLWCASVLVGRARQIRYLPGIGSAFKAAQADFYSLLQKW